MTKNYTVLNCVCSGIIVKEQNKLINKKTKGHIGAVSTDRMSITTYYCEGCGIVYKASVIEQRIKELTNPL